MPSSIRRNNKSSRRLWLTPISPMTMQRSPGAKLNCFETKSISPPENDFLRIGRAAFGFLPGIAHALVCRAVQDALANIKGCRSSCIAFFEQKQGVVRTRRAPAGHVDKADAALHQATRHMEK